MKYKLSDYFKIKTKMRTFHTIGPALSFNLCLSQNIIDSYLLPYNNNMLLRGDSSDGLYKPRDLDIPNDPSRANELWVINENSAMFDFTNGGSTVTYYNYGTDTQWPDYRRMHIQHTLCILLAL